MWRHMFQVAIASIQRSAKREAYLGSRGHSSTRDSLEVTFGPTLLSLAALWFQLGDELKR